MILNFQIQIYHDMKCLLRTAHYVFLKSVFDFGVSEFLLTEIFVPEEGLIASLKVNIKLFLQTVGIRDVEQSMQFWGYLRTIDEHIVLLRNAGFSNFDTGKYNHGAYYIMAKA